MKLFSKTVWMTLVVFACVIAMSPTAMAAEDGSSEESSLWEDVKSAGSSLYRGVKEKAPGWWQTVKDTTSDAVDAVKENGPGWVESAKDKGSELLDKGKDAVQNAQEKVGDFLDDQQNQFWERTEQQIYGGSSGGNSSAMPPVVSDGSAAPGDAPLAPDGLTPSSGTADGSSRADAPEDDVKSDTSEPSYGFTVDDPEAADESQSTSETQTAPDVIENEKTPDRGVDKLLVVGMAIFIGVIVIIALLVAVLKALAI